MASTIDLALTRRAITEALRNASANVPQTTTRPGTVVAITNAPHTTVSVRVDGDTATTIMGNTTGQPLGAGNRVMVTFYPPNGVLCTGLIGLTTNRTGDSGQILATAERDTTAAASGSPLVAWGPLAPYILGHTYQVAVTMPATYASSGAAVWQLQIEDNVSGIQQILWRWNLTGNHDGRTFLGWRKDWSGVLTHRLSVTNIIGGGTINMDTLGDMLRGPAMRVVVTDLGVQQ